MKVSREQAAQNRQTVVDTASRLFRENGLSGVGINEIMHQSGLTHGGFYAQFASKETLAAEACASALRQSLVRWERIAVKHAEDAVAALAADYLSKRNRDAPATGCALVALGADAARLQGPISDAFQEGLLSLVGVLERAAPQLGRDRALAAVSQMVGAMVLARAVSDKDLSDAILAAASKALQCGLR